MNSLPNDPQSSFSGDPQARRRPVELPDPRLECLLSYWSERRQGRAMPPRSSIDPLDMPRLILPFLMLAEVVRSGETCRYRYRIFATELVNAAKGDMTGRFLDDCLPEKDGYRDYVVALYDGLVHEGRPLYSAGDFIAYGEPERPERSTQRLMLPLGTVQEGVTHVLAAQVFTIYGAPVGHPMESAASYREQTHRFLCVD